MNEQNKPELSVIVAVYNEDRRNLVKLLTRIDASLVPAGVGYEVVFVNDGSREPTSKALRDLALRHENVKLVELSRNFGQQAAITAGFDHACGEAVVNMDSDLQDPPELVPVMIEKWKEGYDVVYAKRAKRRDRFLKRHTAFLFYRLLAAVSSVQIPWDTGDFRLIDRTVLDALASLPEKTRFIRGLIPWLGFRQCGVPLDREAREIGESAYTIKKLLSLALDGLLAFSIAPLYLVPVVGLFVTVIAALGLACALIMSGFSISNPVLLFALGFFTGIQILSTGCLALYLAKVLDESRGRPTYIVARRIGLGFQKDERTISSGIEGSARSFVPNLPLSDTSYLATMK